MTRQRSQTLPLGRDVRLGTLRLRVREELRIEWGPYQGRLRLNVRVWAQRLDGTWVPTKKGITLAPAQVAAFVQAVSDAEPLARAALGRESPPA